MKKLFFISIMILAFVGVLQAENLNVKIIYIEGGVTITKANGAQSPAAVGVTVTTGDRIITGDKSVCDLEFDDKSYSRLGENSDLKLSSAELKEKKTIFGAIKKDKNIKIDLVKGAMLSKMKKLGKSENFSIKTPVAVVGVRGTNFQTTSTPGGTNVSVYQGAVAVTNITSNITTMVPAGQSFGISADGAKAEAQSVSTAEVSAAQEVSGEEIDPGTFSGSVETVGSAAASEISAKVDVQVKTDVVGILYNSTTLNQITDAVASKSTVIINFK